ncbi:unnamed protein product, partial [marine sediment metagenome]
MSEIAKTAIVDPKTVVEDGVKIGHYSIIEGNVVIKNGTVIKDHVLVKAG